MTELKELFADLKDAAKDIQVEDRKAIPFSVHGDGPKAAIDEAWDGPKERAKATVEDLRIMSTWVDPDKADTKGGYKLPHHKASGKAVVFRGVVAAMGALLGARGGVDIPSGDRRSVYNHLAREYRRFDKEPPEFRAYDEAELKLMFRDLYPEDERSNVLPFFRRSEDESLVLSFHPFEVRKFDPDNPLPVKIQQPTNIDRVRRFVASDDTLDHYKDVIVPAGWKFNLWRKNAAMMLFHDYDRFPAGKGIGAGVVDNKLMIDAEFDPPEIDEVADVALRKIDHGSLRAGSVGFIPQKWIVGGTNKGYAKDSHEAQLLEQYPDARRIFIEQELLEWTICSIGANPNALAASLKTWLSRIYGKDPISEVGTGSEATLSPALLEKAESIGQLFERE